MANELRHRALVAEIQRLVQVYPMLPPEVKLEILKFLKTPEMMTEVNLRPAQRFLDKKSNSPMKMVNYYVV